MSITLEPSGSKLIPNQRLGITVTINVQGVIFQTNYENVIKIPYLKTKIEQCTPPIETIFVDRPSHIFKHVLGVVTDKNYPYPEKYRYELEFYGVDCTNVKFFNKTNTNIVNKESNVNNTIHSGPQYVNMMQKPYRAQKYGTGYCIII